MKSKSQQELICVSYVFCTYTLQTITFAAQNDCCWHVAKTGAMEFPSCVYQRDFWEVHCTTKQLSHWGL